MSKLNKPQAKVFHYDLYGKRDEKYSFLNENSLNSINWNDSDYSEPEFYFIKKDFDIKKNMKVVFP